MKLNILVVYWHNVPTMRTTTQDHLLCFERHLPHHCYYLNLGDDGLLPDWVRSTPFDLIVFHDLFFCGRWGGRPLFEQLCAKIEFLKQSSAYKIAVPQDEFMCADLLCEFINGFSVGAVFSVSPESEWPRIYRDVDRDRVRFYCVLTGYLEEGTLARIDRIVAAGAPRSADIGYRAGGRSWRQAAWLGRHGVLKIEIADRFAAAAPRHGLATDISTRSEDTFMGDAWYEFLARCKYQIGLEGGASVLDWDGTRRPATLEYVEAHPESTFEEIEQACFPGLDGQLALFALSPRHLEACATRTCQILIEGDYNGVLEPWKHYIPVRKDFSNLDEVLELVRSDHLRGEMVESAWRDVVASGRYTYAAFARFVVDESARLGRLDAAPTHGASEQAPALFARYRAERAQPRPKAPSAVPAGADEAVAPAEFLPAARRQLARIPLLRAAVRRVRSLLGRA